MFLLRLWMVLEMAQILAFPSPRSKLPAAPADIERLWVAYKEAIEAHKRYPTPDTILRASAAHARYFAAFCTGEAA